MVVLSSDYEYNLPINGKNLYYTKELKTHLLINLFRNLNLFALLFDKLDKILLLIIFLYNKQKGTTSNKN